MTALDSSKLIALKLSSLNESDFNWVYSQLTQDVKDELDPIIREIKEMGFEIDSSDINMLVQNSSGDAQERDQDAQLINLSTYDEVAEVFKSESPILFNTLVSIDDWKWEKDQNYIGRTKSSSITIKNIKTKKLLEKSIISTTAIFLKSCENKQSKVNELPQIRLGHFLTSYFKKLFRSNAEWKF